MRNIDIVDRIGCEVGYRIYRYRFARVFVSRRFATR
jgi:hypothetical protein